jgi:hypothetical protein
MYFAFISFNCFVLSSNLLFNSVFLLSISIHFSSSSCIAFNFLSVSVIDFSLSDWISFICFSIYNFSSQISCFITLISFINFSFSSIFQTISLSLLSASNSLNSITGVLLSNSS